MEFYIENKSLMLHFYRDDGIIDEDLGELKITKSKGLNGVIEKNFFVDRFKLIK